MRRSALEVLARATIVALGLTCTLERAAAAQSTDGAAASAALDPTPDPGLARADSLVFADRTEEALAALEERLARAPADFAARWRAARAAVFLGFLASGTDEENRWFRLGAEHADHALEARPDHPEALRWALAAKGSLAVQTGVAESGRLGQEVWTLAQRALALDPASADAHYALGKLEYELLKLSRVQRLLSRPFRRGEIGRATWQDALAFAERAVELDPGNTLYRLGLADTLWRVGRHADAILQLQQAQRLPLRAPADRDFRARAELLLWRIENGIDPTR
jgi:tetratricopeptide (TPR) repeat protein